MEEPATTATAVAATKQEEEQQQQQQQQQQDHSATLKHRLDMMEKQANSPVGVLGNEKQPHNNNLNHIPAKQATNNHLSIQSSSQQQQRKIGAGDAAISSNSTGIFPPIGNSNNNHDSNIEASFLSSSSSTTSTPSDFDEILGKLGVIATLERDSENIQSCSNSDAEEHILFLADHFRTTFYQVFPKREILFLYPLNEFGVKKFLPTTIRPTQLPFGKLYDYQECARFVSEFIRYEPLASPWELPKFVMSPATTLKYHVGDCFDISTVLVSLLIGAGYDAYCILGTAGKHITLKDESNQICPLLLDEDKVKETEEKPKRTTYQVSKRPLLESRFLKHKEEKDKAAAAAAASSSTTAADNNNTENNNGDDLEDAEELKGKRLHCWVMVMPGNRELSEIIFIEPSTGKIIPLQSVNYKNDYTTVRSIWSNQNLWVNMQGEAKDVNKISFDLSSSEKWEVVITANSIANKASYDEFVQFDKPVTIKTSNSYMDDLLAAARNTNSASSNTNNSKNASNNRDGSTAAAAIFDLPASWVPKLTISREEFYGSYAGNKHALEYKKCDLQLFADYKRNDGMVTRLTIYNDLKKEVALEIRETFAHRKDKLKQRTTFPLEKKIVEYFARGHQNAIKSITQYQSDLQPKLQQRRILEFYSDTRVDGLIVRDDKIGVKITETYDDRDDHLFYRSVTYNPGQQLMAQQLAAAALLQQQQFQHSHLHSQQHQQAVVANPSQSQLPSLPSTPNSHGNQHHPNKQQQQQSKSLTPTNNGNNSGSKNLNTTNNNNDNNTTSRPTSANVNQTAVMGTDTDLTIKKMAEKFSPRPECLADDDVYKITFEIYQERIRIDFQRAEDKITNSSRIFTKDGQTFIVQVDPFAKPPKRAAVFEEFKRMTDAEKQCIASIREADRDTRAILQLRRKEEENIELVYSVYDIARLKMKIGAAALLNNINNNNNFNSSFAAINGNNKSNINNNNNNNNSDKDDLTPYMIQLGITRETRMDREFAIKLKEAALRGLKEQILEKAHLIQSRLDEAVTALSRKQSWFQKNQEHIDKIEEGEYIRSCNDLMFKIHVLEHRLARHEDLSLIRFAERDARLRIE